MLIWIDRIWINPEKVTEVCRYLEGGEPVEGKALIECAGDPEEILRLVDMEPDRAAQLVNDGCRAGIIERARLEAEIHHDVTRRMTESDARRKAQK